MNEGKDEYDKRRKVSYVPCRSTLAYNRKALGFVAGLSFTDFYKVIKDGLDDSWCASIGTPQKPPANSNDGNTSSSQSTSAAANDKPLLSQPDDFIAAAARHLLEQLPFGYDSGQMLL